MSDQEIMDLYQYVLKENIELKEQIYSLEERMKTNELSLVAKDIYIMCLEKKASAGA